MLTQSILHSPTHLGPALVHQYTGTDAYDTTEFSKSIVRPCRPGESSRPKIEERR